MRAKSRAMSKQARRQHARIVEHDQFVAAKEIRKIAEVAIAPRAGYSVQQEHPRGVPLIEGPLSDTRGRKFVIEFA